MFLPKSFAVVGATKVAHAVSGTGNTRSPQQTRRRHYRSQSCVATSSPCTKRDRASLLIVARRAVVGDAAPKLRLTSSSRDDLGCRPHGTSASRVELRQLLSWRDESRPAQSIHRRVAGSAASRSSPIGRPHDSQIPYSPAATLARASSSAAQLVAGVLQHRRDALTLEGDGAALGVVLVVGGAHMLGSGNDAVELGGESFDDGDNTARSSRSRSVSVTRSSYPVVGTAPMVGACGRSWPDTGRRRATSASARARASR